MVKVRYGMVEKGWIGVGKGVSEINGKIETGKGRGRGWDMRMYREGMEVGMRDHAGAWVGNCWV